MTTLRLREEALADLTDIADYGTSNHGWAAAEAYIESIDGALAQLKRYPLSERPDPTSPTIYAACRSGTTIFSTCFRMTMCRSFASCIN